MKQIGRYNINNNDRVNKKPKKENIFLFRDETMIFIYDKIFMKKETRKTCQFKKIR